MNQPLYLFGQNVEYSGIQFIVNAIEYRLAQNGRPEGYYYEDHRDVWHHEGALKTHLPPVKPITALEFNGEWQRIYGCTWNDAKSAKLYTGILTFLRNKGLVV